MGRKYLDNSLTTLAGSISSGETTLSVAAGKGANFPSITGRGTPGAAIDHFVITMEDSSGNREKIRVEHRAGDVLGSAGFPLVRGYDGTVPRAWNPGDSVDLRVERKGIQEELTDMVAGGAIGRLFGVKGSTTTGLNFGYYGGQMWVDGVLTTIADGAIAMADATNPNFVERDRTGVVSANAVGFSANKYPIAEVTTAAGAITAITDRRIANARLTGRLLKSVAGGAGNTVLTAAEARNNVLEFTGALTGNRTIEVPTLARKWTVFNNTTGAFTLAVKTAAGTGVIVAQGGRVSLYCDGTNVEYADATPDALAEILMGTGTREAVHVPVPFGGAQIINGKIALSVAGGALTVALKDLAGNDPTPQSPVLVRVPQGNPFNGTYLTRKVAAALSMVLSAGSTLGHVSGIASPVYFYLIDNAGVLELAVSNKFFGGAAVVSTTAEGGAGAADSASLMYSTTARANVPAVVISRWKSTQTTVGTWAATTGEVQQFPFPYKKPTRQSITATGTYTKPWDLLWADVEVQAGGGGAAATANSSGTSRASGGGGGGEYRRGILPAETITATETATVGAGGAAGAAGGTSSFGGHISAIGGGAGLDAAAPGGAGGAGGTGGSGGDHARAGADGKRGSCVGTTISIGGAGGDSHLGGSGSGATVIVSSVTAGTAGNLYGAGAGGTASIDTGGGGGAIGAPGINIVTEHYS